MTLFALPSLRAMDLGSTSLTFGADEQGLVQLFFDLLFPALEVLDFIGENGLAHLDLHLKIIEVSRRSTISW